jgi:hypothetical protein
VDLRREPAAQNRQVRSRGPGGLHDRAIHIELTPVDAAFSVELTMQMPGD